MGYDFQRDDWIKSTRKPHRCEHCQRMIEPGSPATKSIGLYDGYFYTNYIHPECGEAAVAYARMTGLWDEDYVWLHDLEEPEDWRWLAANYPAVAKWINVARRLGEIEADNGLSPAFVCDVLKGRRAPTDAIAGPLGYRRKIVFERVGE